jgi:hypothetical protein
LDFKDAYIDCSEPTKGSSLKERNLTAVSSIERIVLLDFIHRLVSQKTNKIEELKI